MSLSLGTIGAAFALVSVVSAAALAASSAAHRILVLHSERLELPGSVRFDESLRSALAGGGPIDVYTESLDTARFPAPSDRQAQSAFLRRKYADNLHCSACDMGSIPNGTRSNLQNSVRNFIARDSHAWAGWRSGLPFRRLSLGNASMVFPARCSAIRSS